ncbi:MAG: class poly(R)-hydroxyalkanoic acid synthase [Alphaproteobacteria bacterium]|jgi:polyhydroxyalkanoate synthase|nr:class poly(R)-hydroxyalkanoic acid synthase [Alphaproteobacteria bacterium]
MTKQPKEFSFLSPPRDSLGTSGEWKDSQKRIGAENQKTIAEHMKESSVSPYPWLNKSFFSPEEVMAVFTQTMSKMSERIEDGEGSVDDSLVDAQAFLHATLDRFQKKTDEWDGSPFFSLLQQSYLLNIQFLKQAASRSHGLDPLMIRKLTFYTRHLADILSLSAFPLGALQDAQPPLKHSQYHIPKGPIQAFQVGKNLGATPGKIVFQNDFFQLIQYEALTPKVARQPLLIVPSWLHKYYIFDLSPDNSFVQWALESGLTVFVISWNNPDQRHLHKTMADYVLEGAKTALDQVCKITGETKVNVAGYCAGGTLLGCLMAYLKAKKDPRVISATFIAAPFDFSKVDELGIYRSESQQHKLEDYVEKKGYLEGQYMVQACNLLRANDLIWSSDVNHYLLGHIPFPFDMLHWTCDSLRLPPTMHSIYLRNVFLENRLMEGGNLFIEGTPIDLRNIATPLFIMASHEDQVAPWQSVYALTQLTKASPQKFILSTAGHITGAFTHPRFQRYSYWTADSLPAKADDWLKSAKKQTGSWWNEWRQWLETYEGGKVPARSIPKDRILEDAPGSYAKMDKRH